MRDLIIFCFYDILLITCWTGIPPRRAQVPGSVPTGGMVDARVASESLKVFICYFSSIH